MNGSQLHLALVHFPLVGLGFAILANIYGIIKKNDEIKKFALWCYVIVGFLAFCAYITGDSAEKIIKTYPGMNEDIIMPHEQYALFLFVGIMILAAISFVGIILSKTKKELIKKYTVIVLVIGLLLTVLAVKTGSTGGKIRHTEIEKGYYKRK